MKLTANRLCLLVAAWIVATGNHAFWQLLFKVQPLTLKGGLFAASLALAMTGATMFLLRLLSPGRALRVMLTLLLVIAAGASWFIDTYGVAIDSDMLRNVLQTNPAEARDFLGWPLLWRIAWQAGIPAICWCGGRDCRWIRGCARSRDYVLGALAGLALLFGAGLPMYSSYASFFRNQDVARYFITPANVLVGSTTLVRKIAASTRALHQGGGGRAAQAATPARSRCWWCWWWVKPHARRTSRWAAMRATPIRG